MSGRNSTPPDPTAILLHEITAKARLTRGSDRCDRVIYDDVFFFSISCSIFACVLVFFVVLYFLGESFMPKELVHAEERLSAEKTDN